MLEGSRVGVLHLWLLWGLNGGGVNDSSLILTDGCGEDVVGQKGIPASRVLALGINIPISATCLSWIWEERQSSLSRSRWNLQEGHEAKVFGEGVGECFYF